MLNMQNIINKNMVKVLSAYGKFLPLNENKTPKIINGRREWNIVNKDYVLNNPSERFGFIPNKDKSDNNYNIIILDIDTKKGSKGLISWEKLKKELNLTIPFTVKTVSGGYHVYIFTKDIKDISDIKRYNKKQLPDLEFIANEKSYVVTPINNQTFISKDEKGNVVNAKYELLNPTVFLDLEDYIEDYETQFNRIVKYFKDIILKEKLEEEERKNSIKNKIKLNSNNKENFYGDITLEDLKTLLDLNEDLNEDYEDWVKISGAYKNSIRLLELDENEAINYWVEWSQRASNAEKSIKKLKSKWRVLPSDEISIGTLIYHALDKKKELALEELKGIDFSGFSDFKLETYLDDIALFSKNFPTIYWDRDSFTELLTIIEDNIRKHDKRFKLNNAKIERIKKLFFIDSNANKTTNFINLDDYIYLDDYIGESIFKYSDLKTLYFKVGKETIINTATIKEIKNIIDTIMDNIYIIKAGKKAVIRHNNRVATLFLNSSSNKDFDDFKFTLTTVFKDLILDKEYNKPLIDLDKFKTVLKSSLDEVTIIDTNTLLHDKGVFLLPDEEILIKNKQPKLKKSELKEDEKQEIIKEYKAHWDNKLDLILEKLVLSHFTDNKKGSDIAILANSNFGKSLLFKFLSQAGISHFHKIEDFVNNGRAITNASIDSFLTPIAVFDEVKKYPRGIFDVTDTISIRPMQKHIINIKSPIKVFLNADGGIFDNDSLDKQIQNRISVFDFRHKTTTLKELETYKKYKYDFIVTIREYVINTFLNLFNEYKEIKEVEIENKLEIVDKKLESLKKEYKTFEDKLDDVVKEFLETPTRINNLSSILYLNKKANAIVITNPSKNLPEIVEQLDLELAKELSYKRVRVFEKLPYVKTANGSLRVVVNGTEKVIKGLVIDLDIVKNLNPNINLSLIKKEI
jgi:hypothetical protein